jgi:hypothetical protein
LETGTEESLQEEFRDIQLIFNVLFGESCRARCMATAMGPPEVKIATLSLRLPAERHFVRPEFTLEQNSNQVSTPGGQIAPLTHLPMTTWNNF